MKNACIVYNHGNSAFLATETALILDEFYKFGYPFDEVRTLLRADEAAFCEAATTLCKNNRVVLILTEHAQLEGMKTLLIAGGVVTENAFQPNGLGGGLFQDKAKTLILASLDNAQSGVDYVRSIAAPYLQKQYNERQGKFIIRAVGANAQNIQRLLARAKSIDGGCMRYDYTHSYGEDVLCVFYGKFAPKLLVDDVLRLFVEGMGDTVYALEDCTLEQQLVDLLKLRGKKISLAESFTGGGIAQRLVSVPGASAVYFEGLNTYDEASKIKRLGVSEYTLKTVGTVSDRTAYEMASGLLATGDCDVAVATTGLAGPGTDRSMLPVGLCYIAVGTKERVLVYRYKFDGGRENITKTAINYALFLAYKQLKNM